MMTSYYIVAVEDDGDVLASPAVPIHREGFSIVVRTSNNGQRRWIGEDAGVAFENQGDSPEHICDAARDALASVMPGEE